MTHDNEPRKIRHAFTSDGYGRVVRDDSPPAPTHDTRTNERIVAETLAPVFAHTVDFTDTATEVVAALAAAGRLVTPEHDAQVLVEASNELPQSAPGRDRIAQWLRERADRIAKGVGS